MHTVFALMCFVVVIHWLIFPYPSGLLHWHCGNLTIAQVPAKQPWWIWINTSCEFVMNDCITTTKQSTTKPCAYFLGYTVCLDMLLHAWHVASYALPVGSVQAVCHVRSQYRIKRPYRVYVFLGCVSIPVMTISHVMSWSTMDGNRYARTSAHATGSLAFVFLLWVDACRFSDLLRGYRTAIGVQLFQC